MTARVIKWGNGLGVLIPAFAAKSLGLKAGSAIRVLVLEDGISIRPASASRKVVALEQHAFSEEVRTRLQRW